MAKEKVNLYLLAIVAIVAVVGIVVLVLNSKASSESMWTGETHTHDDATDLAGQGYLTDSPSVSSSDSDSGSVSSSGDSNFGRVYHCQCGWHTHCDRYECITHQHCWGDDCD